MPMPAPTPRAPAPAGRSPSTLAERLRQQAERAKGPAKSAPIESDPLSVRVHQLLEAQKAQIARALPRHVTPDRLARVLLTEIRRTPKLLDCTQESLLGAIMLSAQLGLEPGPLGQCYLVPFKGEVNFIIGYRGYLDLMWRSGRLLSIAVHEVCEGDEFEFQYGLQEKLIHKPAVKGRGQAYGYYLVAQYKDGAHFIYWMSREDVDKHRLRSPSHSAETSPWKTDYDAMALKTVVRAAARWMPLSIEIQAAVQAEERPVLLSEIEAWPTEAEPIPTTTSETEDSSSTEQTDESASPPAPEGDQPSLV